MQNASWAPQTNKFSWENSMTLALILNNPSSFPEEKRTSKIWRSLKIFLICSNSE